MADEYIRKADLKKSLEEYVELANANYEYEMAEAYSNVMVDLREMSSADVVQVVRCKDCKHYYFADNRIPQEQRYVCEISGEIWKPDSFCSYGERRKE